MEVIKLCLIVLFFTFVICACGEKHDSENKKVNVYDGELYVKISGDLVPASKTIYDKPDEGLIVFEYDDYSLFIKSITKDSVVLCSKGEFVQKLNEDEIINESSDTFVVHKGETIYLSTKSADKNALFEILLGNDMPEND